MAITVNTTDTFEQWRVKTNQLGSDVDSNIAAVRSDITSNVATINTNIAGNVATINTNIAGNVSAVRSDIASNVLTINTNIAGNVSAVRSDISSNVATITANIASDTGNIVTGNLTISKNVYGDLIKISGSNVMIGRCAGHINAGQDNTFLGCGSGINNTTGCRNVFIGFNSGNKTNIGGCNNFLGHSAGYCNTSGCANTYMGHQAGYCNQSGCSNSIYGFCAGYCNTGSFNNFFGSYAGHRNTSASNNVFVGTSSGLNNITGANNTFVGNCSGGCNQSGCNNSFFGSRAGYNNSTGCHNVFLGYQAGCSVTTGVNNTIIGNVAGSASLSDTVIIAAGSNVRAYIDSTGNVGIGTTSPSGASGRVLEINGGAGQARLVLKNDTTGSASTDGSQIALVNSQLVIQNREESEITFETGGSERVRIDASGLCVNGNVKFGLSTNTNTFLGYNSGVSNTGCNNTFAGFCAGYTNTTGNQNTFIGRSAGLLNVGGFGNTFFGYYAGRNNTAGNNNTFIGCIAGFLNTTGCNNVFIGDGAGYTLGCTTTQSNRIVIGNNSSSLACIQIAWSVASDVRDKVIFGPVPFGKSFLRQINPITYSFKNRETNEIRDDRKRFGFCAQEILALEGSEDIIVNTDDPDHLGMSHEYLIPVLVNAVKELADELDDLRAEIQQLKSA